MLGGRALILVHEIPLRRALSEKSTRLNFGSAVVQQPPNTRRWSRPASARNSSTSPHPRAISLAASSFKLFSACSGGSQPLPGRAAGPLGAPAGANRPRHGRYTLEGSSAGGRRTEQISRLLVFASQCFSFLRRHGGWVLQYITLIDKRVVIYISLHVIRLPSSCPGKRGSSSTDVAPRRKSFDWQCERPSFVPPPGGLGVLLPLSAIPSRPCAAPGMWGDPRPPRAGDSEGGIPDALSG